MDSGPFRGASQSDDRSASKPEPRRVEEQPPLREVPVPPASTRMAIPSFDDKEKKPMKRFIVWGIVAVIVIAVALGAWVLISNLTGAKNQPTGIDSSRFQAVFLTNGQVYFGKLEAFNDNSFKITQVYYPQSDSTETTGTDTATNTDAQTSIKLIRLGDEVHGPDNEMFLTKSQLLYYENLKADSKVSQLISGNEQ